MRVLGIDTSTTTGSIGLIDGDRVVAEYVLDVMETHSSRLMPAIDQMLEKAGLSIWDVDLIAVSKGPGSFTGLRVGVATAKGLAYALRRPIVGVPSLDVLAFGVKFFDGLICPLLDARRGEVYGSIYRGGEGFEKVSDYICAEVDRILEMIDEDALFLGGGARRYEARIREVMGRRARFAEPIFDVPRGAAVCFLGAEAVRGGRKDDLFSFIPMYLRKSEAEVKLEMGKLPKRSLI